MKAEGMYTCMYYYLKSLRCPQKISKKGNYTIHAFQISNSLFFQMFTPASFVPAEIFPSVARTTPSSTGCPAPFHHFFVASTAGRTTTLNWTPFSFVVPTLISFRSKPNLMTMQGRVRFFFSCPFMPWSGI